MFNSASSYQDPMLLLNPREAFFIRKENHRGEILVEFEGRPHVAICAGNHCLNLHDPVEVIATKGIFLIVQPC